MSGPRPIQLIKLIGKLYWLCAGLNYKVDCMNWQELSALLVLATAMSFSPGPNTTLSTALAANHGLKVALRFVCAVPVGWGLLLSLCSFGLGALILAAPPFDVCRQGDRRWLLVVPRGQIAQLKTP